MCVFFLLPLKKTPFLDILQDDGKGGWVEGGVAFMTVLAVLTVLVSTLPSFCWSHKIQDKEATVTVLAVVAVMAVLVMTATPLKLNPPFSVLLNSVCLPVYQGGGDLVGIAKTGSGKTLAFLLPGFIKLRKLKKSMEIDTAEGQLIKSQERACPLTQHVCRAKLAQKP